MALSEEAKEVRRKYKREWQRNNPDKVREYRRRYYYKNKDKHREIMNRYWERKAQKENEDGQLKESN